MACSIGRTTRKFAWNSFFWLDLIRQLSKKTWHTDYIFKIFYWNILRRAFWLIENLIHGHRQRNRFKWRKKRPVRSNVPLLVFKSRGKTTKDLFSQFVHDRLPGQWGKHSEPLIYPWSMTSIRYEKYDKHIAAWLNEKLNSHTITENIAFKTSLLEWAILSFSKINQTVHPAKEI